MEIPSDTERAWAAGFYDGEGYWSTVVPQNNLHLCQLGVSNCYLPNLERFQKVCGGNIKLKNSPSMRTCLNFHLHRPIYILRVSNRKDLAHAIWMLRPYLGSEKRKQLQLALRKVRESHSIPFEIRKNKELFKELYPHLVTRSISKASREIEADPTL